MGEPAALLSWLASTAQLSAQQRLEKFVRDRLFEVLQRSPVAIFIDEIDAIIGTRCHRVLCHWIEHCYALRQTAAPYQNLQFAVFGCAVASAAFAHSPRLLQGDHIAIRPFTLVETYSLDQGFENRIEPSTALLKAIYRWAQGQPFLTQKLCAIAADLLDSMLQPSHQPIVVSPQTIDGWVNSWVRSHILENWRAQDNPMHLRSIFDSLMTSPNREALLALGHRIMGGSLVPTGQTPHEAEILLTGLVIVKNQRLHIANEIYRQLFTVPTQTAALTYPGQSLM